MPASCGACGSVFNVQFCPPKEEGICDNCQGALIQRLDDTREIAVERLRNYHLYSEPVVEFYRRLGVLTTVDAGLLKPEEIYHKVLKVYSEQQIGRRLDFDYK